jgi:histidinol-phosphatase (PHP family)
MDYHVHSLHSMDGRQTIDEACQAMIAQGIQEFCLTEHIDLGHPDPACDIPPIWDRWLDEIRQAQIRYPQPIIRTGLEIGDNPTCRDRIKRMVDQMDPYSMPYFEGKTREEAYRRYCEQKFDSVCQWDDFDSVAHIGYVAKFSVYQGEERPLRFRDAPDALDGLLKRVIELDKCIEVNTSTWASMGAPLPDVSILKRYIELGGECFTFGSDSHDTARDGQDIERAKDLVRSLGGKYQAAFDKRKKVCYRI